MNRKLQACVLSCLLVAASAAAVYAATRPNFTGTWVLDQSRSHSIPRDMEQTMTVTQTGDRLTVETQIKTPKEERTVSDSYTLDGKEAEYMPQLPQGQSGKGLRRGEWLPGGNGFVVYEDAAVEGPEGKVNQKMTRKWLMWSDGTLSIEMFEERPRGDFSTKRVFVRKQGKS